MKYSLIAKCIAEITLEGIINIHIWPPYAQPQTRGTHGQNPSLKRSPVIPSQKIKLNRIWDD